uniref:ABC transporter domain-containing protein n=1 Tax=Heterorhabditis bacteriophora TaxID=37862 RepID=A0A1I7WW88_HETBA
MRTLLRILSNDHRPQGRIRGEFLINGHRLKHPQFSDRIAHVTIEDPPHDLTVVQYLRISSLLHPPATNAFKVENMIDQLIVTLALAPYRDTVCGRLGKSEIQRMKIAAQILKDTDILVCDNVTKDMDIYDVAFVIDYLRDWAIKLNRIVILAIAPSTLDILQMFSKVSILASGRLIYFGNPVNMVRYFESVNFPCPMFRNPCDYYGGKWGLLSICNINDLTNNLLLYRRCWYQFYNSPMGVMNEPLWALFISIIIGIAFFDMTIEKRSGANDRVGFIGSVLYFGLHPLIVIFIKKG